MAKKTDTKSVKAPSGNKKTVSVSDEKGNSTTVRPISNGFLISVGKSTKNGWKSTETYSKTKPKIKF